ncbi:heavy-metal-associated domain-containing protein [Sphingomonas sp. So64.6b]|uniref:heavy-metal-associated domain-containing protein n=1 Tax=Sphingomonas sp. So64.6b TaxID=2997354 RepID=UPI001603F5AD|nr:heavy-metal-associated domain-containing protein [Sphingomonas sp. So64.6b]QNA83941.1 heavy-metal-associated domain-containing protein [Sphingomonas sp. So64.6b]
MFVRRLSRPSYLALGLALVATGGVVIAQANAPEQPMTAADGSGSFEVSGVDVDVTGKTADAARYAGWKVAQRKGWVMLSQRLGGGGGMVSDGTLDAMVSGIVIENEQIGPNRYVARLGVLFSRARAGGLLGVAGQATRSPPMLVVPLQWSGGTGQVFEQKTKWQEAWGRYRTGNSSVDYVRPAGTGPDAMLLNAGQIGRPGRGWWRTILDQYGASDILVPVVRLYRQWPGGPVVGVFEARHGPDNHMIAKFSLRVGSSDGVDALLDAGVKRLDEAYQSALSSGMLNTDSGLVYVPPPAVPVVIDDIPEDPTAVATTAAGGTEATVISIQFETPGASAVSATEAALRAVPGVRSALTSSLALGGVSVMRVGFDGDPAALSAALAARGWQVQGDGTTLRIRRTGQPSQGATPAAADNATSG